MKYSHCNYISIKSIIFFLLLFVKRYHWIVKRFINVLNLISTWIADPQPRRTVWLLSKADVVATHLASRVVNKADGLVQQILRLFDRKFLLTYPILQRVILINDVASTWKYHRPHSCLTFVTQRFWCYDIAFHSSEISVSTVTRLSVLHFEQIELTPVWILLL